MPQEDSLKMGLTLVFLTLVLCAVMVNINCERTNDCPYCTPVNVRIKRVKYSFPPQRFYKLPPMIQPVKGIFSYTPPPNYMMDDDKQSPLFRPPRVSKRPTESMSEEDINNIVKYMSQKDLDKLIEMAEKEKYIDKFKMPEKNERDERTKTGSDVFKADVKEIDVDTSNSHFYGDRSNDYVKESTQPKVIYKKTPLNKEFINYQGINTNINYMKDSSKIMYANSESQMPKKFINPQDIFDYEMNVRNSNTKKDITPDIQNGPIKTTYTSLENNPSNIQDSGLDMNEMKEYFNMVQKFNEKLTKDGHIFTDSSMIKEEELPKPTNLREEEQVISHTNNVPAVVKADSRYEVKNFGDLPLMNYQNSKLHSVSSYNVPHYTVSTTI